MPSTTVTIIEMNDIMSKDITSDVMVIVDTKVITTSIVPLVVYSCMFILPGDLGLAVLCFASKVSKISHASIYALLFCTFFLACSLKSTNSAILPIPDDVRSMIHTIHPSVVSGKKALKSPYSAPENSGTTHSSSTEIRPIMT